jgi:hypothetical protein
MFDAPIYQNINCNIRHVRHVQPWIFHVHDKQNLLLDQRRV